MPIDLTPSVQHVYDAFAIYTLIHGSIWVATGGPKKFMSKTERRRAWIEHHLPRYRHSGRSWKKCTDGKCAIF